MVISPARSVQQEARRGPLVGQEFGFEPTAPLPVDQKQDRYVLGLNWFLTPEAMFKFNVICLEGERDIYDGDGWVYGARAQYFF